MQSRSDVEQSVTERYTRAAGARDAELCCPVEYEPKFLEVIPQEILDRDYGCGDPSRHLRRGETVLDLGSGGGKICFIAAQVVGAEGRVIGVDMNDDMLALAEAHREAVGEALGYHNVVFHKGKIQDLRPMIPDSSVDVVVSNCVLNLVRQSDRRGMFGEIFRVLRSGGRAVISDVVSDRTVPVEMQDDPELWSGCISGAYREDRFLEAFERAGFGAVRLLARDKQPWQTVGAIEFRSITVEAVKGDRLPSAGCC